MIILSYTIHTPPKKKIPLVMIQAPTFNRNPKLLVPKPKHWFRPDLKPKNAIKAVKALQRLFLTSPCSHKP